MLRPAAVLAGWPRSRWFYVILVLFPISSIYILSGRQHSLMSGVIHHKRAGDCVAWRATGWCHPFGIRRPSLDRGCDAIVQGDAGYCECGSRVTVARTPCGVHKFTCGDKCAELSADASLGLRLPRPLSCNHSGDRGLRWIRELADHAALSLVAAGGTGGTAGQGTGGTVGPGTGGTADQETGGTAEPGTPGGEGRRRTAWEALHAVILRHGLNPTVRLPGVRSNRHDWVFEGLRLSRSDTTRMRAAIQGFLAEVPAYPRLSFQGRGIVIVAGGLKYMVPAWVNAHMLRRTGCRLPIEMWFPAKEFPSSELQAALLRLNVRCRHLPTDGLEQRGYTIKVAALMLSKFREVLFMDADNIALRDPTYLFEMEPYNRTGAVFWPDYWGNTVAPDLLDALNVPRSTAPESSFESGQMLLDKQRHWRGLSLAAYMNAYAPLYYELLTMFLGKGDKETFGYGLRGAGEPFHLFTSVSSAGVVSTLHTANSTETAAGYFTGNTMVHYDHNGSLLFMHANFEKLTVSVVDDFRDYTHRWQTLQPGMVDLRALLLQTLGYDPERLMYDSLVALRCAPWFDSYYQSRGQAGDKTTPPLDGFSVQLFGIQFDGLYRRAWPGRYEGMLSQPITWQVRLLRAYFVHIYHPVNGWLRWLHLTREPRRFISEAI